MSYLGSELDCRDWRPIQARVLRVPRRRSDGDSGVWRDCSSNSGHNWTAPCRYAEGLASREYEGAAVQRGGWRMESGVCFRSEAQGHPAGCRGQIRRQRETVLPRVDSQRGRSFRRPPDMAERNSSQEEGEIIMPTNVNDIIKK